MKFILLCHTLILLWVSAVDADTADTYRAAVVEYNAIPSILGNDDRVLRDYVQKIQEAKKNGADIIVFPELTINFNKPIMIPDEEEKAQPWTEPDKYSKVLYELSKVAYESKIYVVVNTAEKALNETAESNEDEYIFFNTNFVLDPTGTVISRYRKINLYGEAGRLPSLDNKLGVFETNFGVKFGHFICFDLLFALPALQVLNKENVTNVIYPTMWFSKLPFLTAVQVQESWAFTHNVNLLAAGANQPRVGSTGTGIYSGKRGRLTAVMYGTSKTTVLYADVPKNPRLNTISTKKTKREADVKNYVKNTPPSVMDNLLLKPDNFALYQTVLLAETGEYFVKHGNVECSADVKFLEEPNTELSKYLYRLVTFDGTGSFSFDTRGVSDCLVVACTGSDVASCSKRFPKYSEVWPKNRISSIDLHAVVPVPVWNETLISENVVYHPVTLDTSIMPLAVDDYDYTIIPNKEGYQDIVMKITQVEQYDNVLYTFGIMGRAFERDGQPPSVA